MMTFLKILLAVFISIIVLIALAFYWFKRKVGRFVKNAMAMAELMPSMPTRERLTRLSRLDLDELDDSETLAESLKARKADLSVLGYHEAGVFARLDEQPLLLFTHAERPVFVVLSLRDGRWCLETLVLTTAPKAFWQREQAQADRKQLPHLELTAAVSLDLAIAIETAETQHGELRPLRAEQFLALYERVSAMESDQFLSERPTLAWTRARVDSDKAKTLSEEQWQNLQETIEGQWKAYLDSALQDEAQRKLGWTAATSERLAGSLVIVHRHTTIADLESAFAAIELAEPLIKQLQQQNLSDRQIFDEVNQRLDAPDKLIKLAQLTSPIPADVYLPARLAEQAQQPDPAFMP